MEQSILYSASLIMQRAEVVHDVYDAMLYALCFSHSACGGFVSVDGKPDYFDAVVGSYRTDRIGKKGGIKIWEYEIPAPGKTRLCKSSIWLYLTPKQGWLIGLNTAGRKLNTRFIESIVLAASIAIEHIKKRESKVEGRDMMTGLYNREMLYKDLSHLMNVARVKGLPLYLLFIDLNNVKAVNDVLGHETGDRVLASQAFEIKKQTRGLGNAYRYGGDEFCVVLIGTDREKVDRIIRRIEIASEQAPGGITVSASVGLAVYNGDDDIENFIKRADTEMYNRKELIKNRGNSGSSQRGN